MNEYTIILPDSEILTFKGDRIEAGQFGVRIYVNDKIVGIVPNFVAAWKEQDEGRRCCCPDCRRPNVTISGREFSGVLSRASADSVTLDREGLTEPGILRLAANDLRRNYHLGIYGLPKSLPATLDALADAMEGDR